MLWTRILLLKLRAGGGEGANSNVVGLICPTGWNRVNWPAKSGALPLPFGSYGPDKFISKSSGPEKNLEDRFIQDPKLPKGLPRTSFLVMEILLGFSPLNLITSLCLIHLINEKWISFLTWRLSIYSLNFNGPWGLWFSFVDEDYLIIIHFLMAPGIFDYLFNMGFV